MLYKAISPTETAATAADTIYGAPAGQDDDNDVSYADDDEDYGQEKDQDDNDDSNDISEEEY